MTGYTVHTGSSDEFAEGWDRIFKKSTDQKSTKKTPAKAKKTATKKKKKSKS
ncbi:hypothetical protein [Thalassoroseus pseudoceratinae]|uniref:hypothetical protein n=1 Tax=Thalassoroseus pseudoceratinae TaxID=2713176 RepID=UPI0014209F9B|nr:hypothetical protein [Thalassoroseus pseudoceratinae]